MNMIKGLKIEKKTSRKFSGSFTLIELLIVIAIIAILAGMLLLNFPSHGIFKKRCKGSNLSWNIKAMESLFLLLIISRPHPISLNRKFKP